MYEGLKSDCETDPFLLVDLDRAKAELQAYYRTNYASRARPLPSHASQSMSSISSHSSSFRSPEKVNFTLRYQKKDRVVVDKLEEYFKLPREDFDSCKPLQWWFGRQLQFPNLYCLVRDVFSIPGKFIASSNFLDSFLILFRRWQVPRLLLSKFFQEVWGRDTISLRHASLIPDTIRVLMLVKHRLRLARIQLVKEDRYK